jgi:hypothetical protein
VHLLFRFALAILIPPIVLFGAVQIYAVTGRVSAGATLAVVALLTLSHISSELVRSPAASWRPLRLTLAYGTLVALFLFLQLSAFAAYADWSTFSLFLLAIILAIVLQWSISRLPRLSLAFLGLIAAWSCYSLLRTLPYLARPSSLPSSLPTQAYSMALTCFVYAAWFAALWHGRRLFQATTIGTNAT